MEIVDQTIVHWLNLLHTSPTFAIRVDAKTNKATVQSPQIIPNFDGEYWLAGKTILKCGIKLESIFQVDTDSSGSLVGAYWRVDGKWWNSQNSSNMFDFLGINENDAFPFDWSYFIPLEYDLYHS